MATVYLAHDAELDRPVAVKVLARNLATDQTFRARFVREARLAARLTHPNVVQVFDAGEDGGSPYIVMEYVEGESLAAAVRRRRALPPEEVVDVARQVCAGLQHAHDRGLVHRDLKPANLLRRTDGCVKIADFGIARAVEATQLTQVGTVLGTATYLAPEQAAGRPVTAASDLYTLGVTLYELVEGEPPYRVESLADLPIRQRSIRPPAAPPRLANVVMDCLAIDPGARPPSAAAVAERLDVTAPTRVASPPTAPTRLQSARHIAPRRALPALVALVAAAIVLAIVVATRSGGDSPPTAVEPVPHASSPAAQAHALRRWIRDNSR
jgi:serine/threonine-protein kinase